MEAVLVAVDALLVHAGVAREVTRLCAPYGIEEKTIYYTATHTHCGPGGWGPNEELLAPDDTGTLFRLLADTHRSFETPCGAYGHFKIARSLLRVTKDSRYGDSMERVLYNLLANALRHTPSDGSVAVVAGITCTTTWNVGPNHVTPSCTSWNASSYTVGSLTAGPTI